MSYNKLIDNILQSLQPDPDDYAQENMFMFWMNYAIALDKLTMLNFSTPEGDVQPVVDAINKMMSNYTDTQPEHQAGVDAASTIESLLPAWRGSFEYGV